jgi:hypothetical protein
MVRFIKKEQFNDAGFTDENSLARLGVTAPDWISRKMTYLYGKEAAPKFSFLAMTEGQGNVKYQSSGRIGAKTTDVNDVQYKWPVMGKMRHTVCMSGDISYAGQLVKPGLGNAPFKIATTDRWGIKDYGLLSPDGKTQLQILTAFEKVGSHFEALVQLRKGNPAEYVDPATLAAGKYWLLIAPKVSESGSRGNESRQMTHNEMTNQTSFDRYTQKIEGNVANKVSVFEFDGEDTVDGKATRLWINEEQRQFDVWIRTMKNLDLYLQEYNRINGEIPLKYYENDKPIPIGAGVKETVCEMGQHITYGDDLPLKLIDKTILQMFDGNTDNGTRELIAHGGKGFGRMVHKALMSEAVNKQFTYSIGQEVIGTTSDGKLSYGKYFAQYKTNEGHTFTYVNDPMFDKGGSLGELDIKNGYFGPDGLPRSSYTGVVMDYSMIDGERNVELVAMKGQSWIAGVYEGMSPIPAAWRVGNKVDSIKQLSTDKDEASYEIKTSSSINIKDASHCIIFEMEM